jgi:hypothetical protein
VATTAASIFCRCFGAQAMTCGVLLGAAPMNPTSFRVFAASMLPYIAWNFWVAFSPKGRSIFTNLIWFDFLGNIVFAGGSLYCAKLLSEGDDEPHLWTEKKADEPTS